MISPLRQARFRRIHRRMDHLRSIPTPTLRFLNRRLGTSLSEPTPQSIVDTRRRESLRKNRTTRFSQSKSPSAISAGETTQWLHWIVRGYLLGALGMLCWLAVRSMESASTGLAGLRRRNGIGPIMARIAERTTRIQHTGAAKAGDAARVR